MPLNMLEEKLLACAHAPPVTPWKPTSERTVASTALLDSMRDYLFARWTINDFALVGVDGGAKWACSSWAVVLDDESYGSAIEGEDATPCTAELLAILLALEAVAGTPCELDFAGVAKVVDIVSDCKPAISLATGGFCSHDRYRSQRSILAAVAKCAAAKVVVNFVWVPSHNKFSKNFVVPAEHTE